MSTTMNKKELAAIAGLTYRRLYDIDRELPQDKKLFVDGEGGKYDLAVFVQRWVAYNVEKEAGDDKSLDEVKAVHERVKTRKTELEVARMEGTLADIADVRKLWGDIAGTVTQNLLHLPSTIAPMLTMMDNTDVIASIIDGEIRKALNQIADTPLPDYVVQDGEAGDESEEDAGEV